MTLRARGPVLVSSIAASSAEARARILHSFEERRAALAAQIEESRRELAKKGTEADATLTSSSHETIGKTHETFDGAIGRVKTSAELGGKRARSSAEDSASDVEDAIAEARAKAIVAGIGGKDVSGVLKDLERLDDVPKDLRARGKSAAGGLSARAAEVADAIEAGRDPVLDTVRGYATDGYAAQEHASSWARFALERHEIAASDEFDRAERAALAALDRDTAVNLDAARLAADAALARYREGSAARLAETDAFITATLNSASGTTSANPIGEKSLDVMRQGFDARAEVAASMLESTEGPLEEFEESAANELGAIADGAQLDADRVLAAAREACEGTLEDAAEAFTETTEKTHDAEAKLHEETEKELGARADDFDAAVESDLDDLEGGLADRAEAAQKAAKAAVDALDAAASSGVFAWLKKQLSQFIDTITSASFWIGLGLTLLGVAFLGEEVIGWALIGAVALIGAFASAIAQLLDNLIHGRPLFDGVFKAFITGGVFGAVLAGVGVALGTGYLAVAASMLAAGALTIVTNLVTGRPWDESLLSNVAVTGGLAAAAHEKNTGRYAVTEEGTTAKGQPQDQPSPVPVPAPANATGLPPELAKIYEPLSPKAKAVFDLKWRATLGKTEDAKVTPEHVARMLRALDGAAKGSGGDLEKALEKIWDNDNPSPAPVHGKAASALPGLREKLGTIRARVDAAKDKQKGIGYERLRERLSKTVEKTLARMESGELEATPENVAGVRANLEGLEAEYLAAQKEKDVVGLDAEKRTAGSTKGFEVDVVANKGKRWVEVKNIKRFGIRSSTWKALREQMQRMADVAHDPRNWIDGKPPELVIRFPKGVSLKVSSELKGMGFVVLDGQKPLVVPPPQRAREDDDE
ncbi:MAG TPA: hypothetical protein VGM88_18875 [Kofleriaceae bacterium]